MDQSSHKEVAHPRPHPPASPLEEKWKERNMDTWSCFILALCPVDPRWPSPSPSVVSLFWKVEAVVPFSGHSTEQWVKHFAIVLASVSLYVQGICQGNGQRCVNFPSFNGTSTRLVSVVMKCSGLGWKKPSTYCHAVGPLSIKGG